MASKPPISIVYILPQYDPAVSGHFFHLYELLERAAKALDIFLIIEKAESYPNGLPFDFYCQRFSAAPLRFMELVFVSVRERMKGRKYFYTHYSFFGAISSWLVTKIFGGRAYYWNCGMPWLYKRGSVEESAFRFALRHSILVTGTAGIAREYQARYGLMDKNIRILPNWVNTARFSGSISRESARKSLGIPEGVKVVLFAHHVSRRKGSHKIVPTALSVTKAIENVIFIVIGSGPEYDDLDLEIRNKKLENCIRLVGEVPNKEIQNYFVLADVFFMPSEEEGFPNVLLEAMAAGVPYVASDVGGVREITPPEFQNCIVGGSNVELFSTCITGLLECKAAEREKLADAGKKWVMQYDIGKVVPKFTGLFS